MPREPVAVAKSAGSIPQQVINEEPGPDGDVSSYRPHGGPYGLRHRAIPPQWHDGGDQRSDRGRAATQSDLPSEGNTSRRAARLTSRIQSRSIN